MTATKAIRSMTSAPVGANIGCSLDSGKWQLREYRARQIALLLDVKRESATPSYQIHVFDRSTACSEVVRQSNLPKSLLTARRICLLPASGQAAAHCD
jgi:hypothetical protein